MLRFATLLAKAAVAISLQGETNNLVCNDMEITTPVKVTKDDTVIENMIIYAEPTSANSKSNNRP